MSVSVLNWNPVLKLRIDGGGVKSVFSVKTYIRNGKLTAAAFPCDAEPRQREQEAGELTDAPVLLKSHPVGNWIPVSQLKLIPVNNWKTGKLEQLEKWKSRGKIAQTCSF